MSLPGSSHQDEGHTTRVLGLLRHAADDGALVVVATHDERISEVADVVVRLASGTS